MSASCWDPQRLREEGPRAYWPTQGRAKGSGLSPLLHTYDESSGETRKDTCLLLPQIASVTVSRLFSEGCRGEEQRGAEWAGN